MPPVRVGLIGFGTWARQAYAPVLRQLREVEVAGVAAPSEASRQLAQTTFDGPIALYSRYEQLLADEGIQAVMIALPNELHAAAVRAAVAADKHLFYEPPVGLNGRQCRGVLDALDRSRRVVQADLELRYLPVMDAVRRLLDADEIGEPRMASVRLWCDWGCRGGARNQDAERDGFFLWLGCWYLDVLDCVFAAAPTSASVAGGYAMNGRLMDHGWATLTYPQGRIGQLEFSLIAVEGAAISLRVAATRGEIEADLEAGTFRWRREGAGWQEGIAPCSQPICGFAGMRESIKDFLQAVVDGRPARADTEVCRRVHRAALACARAENRFRRQRLNGE